jgi:hypothetical protein
MGFPCHAYSIPRPEEMSSRIGKFAPRGRFSISYAITAQPTTTPPHKLPRQRNRLRIDHICHRCRQCLRWGRLGTVWSIPFRTSDISQRQKSILDTCHQLPLRSSYMPFLPISIPHPQEMSSHLLSYFSSGFPNETRTDP